MTIENTQKVLAYITAAYPRYFANVAKGAADNMIAVWNDTFADYSVTAVMAGVKGYISADNSGFPPSPGQIIEYINIVGHPADHSGTEAWSLVRRAVNVPWDQFDASFATLPKAVQVAVGSPASLKELAQMDNQQFETVAQSNFLRMYDAARRREATEDKFSNAVFNAKEAVGIELKNRAEARQAALPQKPVESPQLEQKPDTQDDRVSAPQDRLAALRKRLGML